MKKIINILLVFILLFSSKLSLAKSFFSEDILNISKIEKPVLRLKAIRSALKRIDSSEWRIDFLAKLNIFRATWWQQPLQWFYFPAWLFESKTGREILEEWIPKNLNVLVIDAENYWRQAYEVEVDSSNSNLVKEVEIIREKISALKKDWVYTIARISVLKNPNIAWKYPLKTVANNPYDKYWVDWSSEEVIRYYKEMISWIKNIWFDEVQLDYIRFPIVGYAIQKEQNWKRRVEIITNFVREMFLYTRTLDIKLSMDTFWIVAWNRDADIRSTGQDLKQLINYVDYLSPMIYPSHFDPWFWWYNDYSKPYIMISVANKMLLKLIWDQNIGKIRPWLQWFNLNSPTFWSRYIFEQIQACKDLWIHSYLIWTRGSWYSSSIRAMNMK